jgi:hypothetical protein
VALAADVRGEALLVEDALQCVGDAAGALDDLDGVVGAEQRAGGVLVGGDDIGPGDLVRSAVDVRQALPGPRAAA